MHEKLMWYMSFIGSCLWWPAFSFIYKVSIQTSANNIFWHIYTKTYTSTYCTIRLPLLFSYLSQQIKQIVIYFLELAGAEVCAQRYVKPSQSLSSSCKRFWPLSVGNWEQRMTSNLRKNRKPRYYYNWALKC